jgi:hypothetical protein
MTPQMPPKPYEQDYYPPMPTEFTKKMRTNFIYQVIRFIALNIRMLKMVRKH